MKVKLKSTQSFTFVFLGAVFVLLAFVQDSYSQTTKRNLEEYKQGGSFNLVKEYFPGGNQEKAPIRRFLWNLWQNKSKGYFDVTRYTREGDSYQCRFFVEPNTEEKWQVVSECRTSQCPYVSKKACRRYLKKVFVNSYNTVERIKYQYKDLMPSESKVSNDEELDFADFALRLKNIDETEEF